MPSFIPLHSTPIVSLVVVVLLVSLVVVVVRHPSTPSPQQPRTSSAAPNGDHLPFFSSSENSNSTIASHLRHLTLRPHLAGTPSSLSHSDYVRSHFRTSVLNSSHTDYHPLLSYPLHSSLSLLVPGHSPLPLTLSDPPRPGLPSSVPPYHAYSPSTSLVAPPVFANYGRDRDYRALLRLGVDVRGCIVVIKSGAGYRGAAVSRAADRGAAAVVIFRDEEEGEGERVGRGGVERGTVLLGGPGDPLTPGWAAEVGAERLGLEDERVRRRFPGIPSMPVPRAAGEEIVGSLGGPPMPDEWRGSMRMAGGIGPGPGMLNFTFKEEKKLAMIRNVFGIIEGREEPDRYIILGNHRDAWTYGAVDPNSGTAVLLDVARRFGVLLQAGWRPRRTIVLCSWDAEEFGMIGSTEWVEQNIAILGLNAVAYLNIDCAVQGPGFFASASPQLDKLLLEVTRKVKDPDSEGKTVFQTWEEANEGIKIGRLSRMDSDFSAFVHHAGIPSIDMYFGKDFPVYHTAFDSYDWMERYGDPYFHRHVAAAEIWGRLALDLADSPILPFDYSCYPGQLQKHASAMYDLLESQSLHPINTSIHEFASAVNGVHMEMQELTDQVSVDVHLEHKRRSLNDRMMHAERGFLEADGLKGRTWFKHTVYAPSEDHETSIEAFPGIIDAIYRHRNSGAKDSQMQISNEIWRVARAIQRAAQILRGDLS